VPVIVTQQVIHVKEGAPRVCQPRTASEVDGILALMLGCARVGTGALVPGSPSLTVVQSPTPLTTPSPVAQVAPVSSNSVIYAQANDPSHEHDIRDDDDRLASWDGRIEIAAPPELE